MLSKSNRISPGHKEETLKCTLSDLRSQPNWKSWRGRASGLSAGTRVQSQTLQSPAHCLGQTWGIWGWFPEKSLSQMGKFLLKILASCGWNYKLIGYKHQELDSHWLIKDLSTCIISWTTLQASSLLAAIVTSFLAAGPLARTTRAGKSVL